jgi:hypothetical protein
VLRLLFFLLAFAPSFAMASAFNDPAGFSPSGSGVLVPGGTLRPLAAIESDKKNVLNLLPQTSGAVDYTSTINGLAAIAGTTIRLPNTGTPYRVGALIFSADNVTLECDYGTVIQTYATTGNLTTISGNAVKWQGCNWGTSNTPALLPSLSLVTGGNFRWYGGSASGLGAFTISAATGTTIDGTKFFDSTNSSVRVVNGSVSTDLLNIECERGLSLCLYAQSGSHGGRWAGNWTFDNRRELIGTDSTTYGFRISDNDGRGTGDNCFTITGSKNVISNNIGIGCAFSGMGILGSQNIVNNFIGRNNGQAQNSAFKYYNASAGSVFAGFAIYGDFGGAGQDNIASGIDVDDDQTVMTQSYDFRISHASNQWVASTVYAAGTYIYNSGNFYLTSAGGTAAASGGPTCTTGTCVDNTITWSYLSTAPEGTNDGVGNRVSNLSIGRASINPFQDTTIQHQNFLSFSPIIYTGTNNPDGTAAPLGSIYTRMGSNIGSSLYVMETSVGGGQPYGNKWSPLATAGGGLPTITGCGTSPTLDTLATTSKGSVAEGSGATGCVVTFSSNNTFGGVVPACQITWYPGGPAPAVVIATNGITLTNPTGTFTNARFSWFCQK